MKKALISLIIILAVALIAIFFLRQSAEEPRSDDGGFGDLLPFGSGGDDAQSPSGDEAPNLPEPSGSTLLNERGVPISELFPISDAPIAGAVIFTRGQLSVVRYVDRATGHIFEAILPASSTSSSPLIKTKITNNTLPKIYEAIFQSDGSNVVLRSLKDDFDAIENTSLALTAPRSTSTPLYGVSATLLRGNFDNVAASGNTLFYSFKDSGSIASSAFNGNNVRTISTTGLNAIWKLSPTGNNLIIYTKASSNTPGYAYRVNGGVLTKLLGPLNGLTAVPNNAGNRIIYSYVENRQPKTWVRNLQSNAFSEILPITLVEKCVWSVRQPQKIICGAPVDGVRLNEPESWYQGVTSYSDSIWLFDTNSEIAQVITEPKARFNLDLDVIEPKLSPNEEYLIFTNKRDLSLWALKLERI